MDVDERRGEVLRAIVEEHIETAQPVSSQTVARSRGLGVSSATVRNDMTALERDGYLSQPHTSAGRVPTDRGYRYFVDRFADPRAAVGLGVNQRRAVSEFFRGTHTALEDLLHETSGLLARITRHAAVVVGPPTESARVRPGATNEGSADQAPTAAGRPTHRAAAEPWSRRRATTSSSPVPTTPRATVRCTASRAPSSPTWSRV